MSQPDRVSRQLIVCDHCDGTGRVWEPCHVGDPHEYHCTCPQEIECGNCDGSGRVYAT